MLSRNLRQVPRISYYEPEEPDLDQYVFCEKCGDFVFEYCSIHGPLLVIPDDKIYDKNRKPAHYIDAGDASRSNWMRYVNCARHWREQNLVAFQYQGQLYYRTIKIIPRFTELMVFYGSEFACELDVDLGKYNSPTGYAQKFGAPIAKKRKPNDENAKSRQELSNVRLTDEASTIQGPTVISSSLQDKVNETKNASLIGTNDIPPQVLSTAEIPAQAINESESKAIAKARSETMKNQAVTKNTKVTMKHTKKKTIVKEIIGTKCKMSTKTCKDITSAQSKDLPDAIISNTPNIIPGNEIDKNKNTGKIDAKASSGKNGNPLDPYYYCNDCDKKFVSKQDVQRHLRLHDPHRAFVCEICKLRYTEIGNLNYHINSVHTKQKQFACTFCDKIFYAEFTLKTHMRTHTGEKVFACEICNKRFSQSGNLKIHMRTHTGEKPYACEICNKRFNQSGVVKIHMRTHTGEKPYACEICNERFNQSGYLKIHMRTHTGEKPYACEICNERFARTRSVKNHLMKIHLKRK